MHQQGYSPHNAGHNIHGAHHIHNVQHGPFQTGPFQSGPSQGRFFYRNRPYMLGYGTAGSIGHQRTIVKCVVVFGVVLLAVGSVLIFCGILSFAGVIRGHTFSRGVPLLGFGGVTFVGGLLFTVLACIAMKSTAYQEQTPAEIVCTPPEQQAINGELVPLTGKDGFSQQPNVAAYGQQPSVAAYGQQPNVVAYGQQPNVAAYGQQPNVAAYGQQPNVAAYGQQPNVAAYGQQPNVAAYGQQPNVAAYGQQSNVAAYGQQPNVAAYGQQPNVAAYGQPYGQPPGNVQPNWYPPTAAPLPASAPPPYGEAAAVYPGQVLEPTSTQAPYPQIGFAVPSVTNP